MSVVGPGAPIVGSAPHLRPHPHYLGWHREHVFKH